MTASAFLANGPRGERPAARAGLRLAALLAITAVCLLLPFAHAGEVIESLTIDGTRYDYVRFGPVNNGKIVIFHGRGSIVVPVEKLPEPYARQFGAKPAPAAKPARGADVGTGPSIITTETVSGGPAQPTTTSSGIVVRPADQSAYEQDCARRLLLQGKLRPKADLVFITGLFRGTGFVEEDGVTTKGITVELARKKKSAEKVPAYMELRPGLWEGTGTQVFLRDVTLQAEADSLVRVFVEEGPQVEAMRTFHVARVPTIEEWRKLR